MRIFTTEIAVINGSFCFTVDFSGGTRRGRWVPFASILSN